MYILILFITNVSFSQVTDRDCKSQHSESYHWEMESLISQLSRLTIETQVFESRRAQLIEKHNEMNTICEQNARAPASLSIEEAPKESESSTNAEEFQEIE